MTAIRTVDGFTLDFLVPRVESINIRNIARALSNTCRFAGQIEQFYSVAQHSVLVSNLVPREHALQGLLHDGAEAYCHDITTPLKKLLLDYQEIEARVWVKVAERFGVPILLHPSVKEADALALTVEDRDIRHLPESIAAAAVSSFPIIPLPPDRAHVVFMNRWDDIVADLNLDESFG